MKRLLRDVDVPRGGLLITCSSHEPRCLAATQFLSPIAPEVVLLFHYNHDNPIREQHHVRLREQCTRVSRVVELLFSEGDAVASFTRHAALLKTLLRQFGKAGIVFDMTVFTKRHLLMMLNWLDDLGCWDALHIIYSEPDDYDASEYMPLSFGISSIQQIPGFPGIADASRPLHLALMLGYEGERALATYEHVQPIKTTLIIPDPPARVEWAGRTERFNHDLIARLGRDCVRRADAIDPEAVVAVLKSVFGPVSERGDHARVVCPLGTKPQALGLYLYARESADPPAVIYAGPLRHDHRYYSHGVGNTWLLVEPR